MKSIESIGVDLKEFEHVKKAKEDKHKKDVNALEDKNKSSKKESAKDSYNKSIKDSGETDASNEVEGTSVEIDELPDTGLVDDGFPVFSVLLFFIIGVMFIKRAFHMKSKEL